ncbi:MAG TPA: hypothetical protein VHV83_03275, partial [Armatimonadota bacterium]|nr:hypothetical protein [Armatimonadota bacterium]
MASHDGTATITMPAVLPGYYDLTCTSNQQQVTASMGVLINRGNAPLPVDGRVCSDAALAWLSKKEDIPQLAHIIRMAGIPWVRERLSWNGIEPTAGERKWADPAARYQTDIDSLSAEGIHVQQIWHDAPQWTHPAIKTKSAPDDLRTVYAFTRDAARYYNGKIQAWEIWNEPDIGFWDDLSDRFAGFTKAAYLGLKDGNPTVQVFPGALCRGYSTFSQNVYDTITGYGDGFNYHAYTEPANHAATLKSYAKLLDKTWVSGKPIRITEAGIRVDSTDKVAHMLTVDDQRKQCQFVPAMLASALAAGNEKAFFFILPQYYERTVQFGSLRMDLTPNPGFVALSAAANIIGQSTYLGQYKVENDAVSVYAFSTPRGNVLVAWANTAATLNIPTEKGTMTLANIFGAEETISAQNGRIDVKVGPDAVYLIDAGNALSKNLITPKAVKPAKRQAAPSHIVLVGHDDRSLGTNRSQDAYVINNVGADGKLSVFTYQVDAYNFSAQAVRGSIHVQVPHGWKTSETTVALTLQPMGREVHSFTVTPDVSAGIVMGKIAVTGTFGKERVILSESFFVLDPTLVTPLKKKELAWADPSLWQKNNADIAPTEV